ncbi:hypothetical protein KXD93_14925 [Mucilaginibacter sp. BJC16-A38]|uniref:hypothetical protein n=1 Tax=Mucilaginibacter phenanthrenivorans TaxID=1234842 RepID=UPI0021577FF3|nr:hypothetical protein [Mucilaginibacter phenanthrenivorans]MCR8558948.1 hypothetical protein [Mucilaginibacter phenanthrenivorans]
MKNKFYLVALLLVVAATHAQTVPLPPFIKWDNNNAPGCKNVFVTKDSITMAVKNKCVSEGVLANWRPSVGVSNDHLHFAIPANGSIQLTITYKFKAQGGDVLSFYGTFEPESDNSDIAFSRSLQIKSGDKSLPEAGGYTQAVLLVNFSNESDKPVWNALAALKGSMNFNFNVTSDGGETHQGSYAVIREVKLEVK